MDLQQVATAAAASTVACFVIQGLSNMVFGTVGCYKSLEPKLQHDWDTRVVGIVHALIQSVGCLQVLAALEPTLSVDFDGYNWSSQRQIAIALGFFVWDLIVCVVQWELPFVAHAAACCLVYFFCSWPQPFIQYSGCFFLLFELSTPFLHCRGIMLLAKTTDNLVFTACHYMFPIVFFLVRIVAGVPVSYFWFLDMIELVWSGKANYPLIAVCYMLLNLLLNGLNLFWFSIIAQKALGMRSKKAKS